MSAPDSSPHPVWLRGGARAVTRPIQSSDAAALTRGLDRLSPAGNAYRFLHYRQRFTAHELHYLTHCDFTDHIAVVLAILDKNGRETDQVGVARCIRTEADPTLAEAAVVLVDEWQQHGGGRALLRHLARLAWAAGIRRWQAFSLVDNAAAPRTFAHVSRPISQRSAGAGTVESVHELFPP